MLDPQLFQDRLPELEAGLKKRNLSPDQIGTWTALSKRRKELIQQVEALKATRNASSKKIGALMGQAKSNPAAALEAETLKAETGKIGDQIKSLDDELKTVEEKFLIEVTCIPNLPADAVKVPALLHTFEPNDAALRDLFRLNLDESLEPAAPQFRTPSLPYARVGIAFNEVKAGLPPNAPIGLRAKLVEASAEITDDEDAAYSAKSYMVQEVARDNITSDDIIVGGPAHLQ
ncbi:MAG: hypothetical protein EOP09_12860, partial [Proteobacteria bacterium]